MQRPVKVSGTEPASGRYARLVFVTVIEAGAIYAWLRLDDSGEPWWGLLVLALGEALETRVFKGRIAAGARQRWGPIEEGSAAATHFPRIQRINDLAGNAEFVIWVLWLAIAEHLGQPIAAAVLLVLMHIKHHVEAVAIRDIPYRTGVFSIKDTFATVMEVGGAVAALALIKEDHLTLAAVLVFVGLLIEHWILINGLRWEMRVRDVRLPRDPRWKPAFRPRDQLHYIVTHFAPVWKLVQRIKPLESRFNRYAINKKMTFMEPRPNALSTMAPYTSWASLTDRTFSGRHLPPVPAGAKRPATTDDGPPSIADVSKLFMRDGDTNDEMIECPKSTVLFSFFAQWVTDGFLRTERPKRGAKAPAARDTRKNESTHQIDLAQLYGLDSRATAQLRTGHGLLASQIINGEEYPQWLCRDADGEGPGNEPKRRFDRLPLPFGFDDLALEDRNKLFAMGTDTRNLGFMAFNVMFLREHNRIARQLASEHLEWDSDQVFETARNILTVVLLKLLVDEYINHISAGHFQVRLRPGSFPNAPWDRPNWMSIEFNLLYRWHSLVPSTLELNGEHIPVQNTLSNADALISSGLGQFMAAASTRPAGRIGLFNTDSFLVKYAESPSIVQARKAGLRSYNDYRRLCLLPPAARFDEISPDPRIQRRLAALYDSPEDIEFYVGLFAEESGPDDVLPPLMSTMVSCDAFSQALTNPLLAPQVYNEQTFSATGMEIIETTKSIQDIVNRNVPAREGSEPYVVSLTRQDYKHS